MNLGRAVGYSVLNNENNEVTEEVLTKFHKDLQYYNGYELGHFIIDLFAYMAKYHMRDFNNLINLIDNLFGRGTDGKLLLDAAVILGAAKSAGSNVPPNRTKETT